jgi:type IV secretion system protein TrbJ
MNHFSRLSTPLRSHFATRSWSKKPMIYAVTVTAAILLFAPFPAAGLFGIGDVVFDPTSYATLGKIWSSDVSTYAKVTEEVAQLGKIYAQGMAMYNVAMAMAKRIDSLHRTGWKTVETAFVADETRNRYGETANWPITVNGSPTWAKTAWQTGTLLLNGNTDAFLRTELLGNSGTLAQLASIEEQDGSASKCLAIIAEYRTALNENELAIDNLQADDDSDSDDDNSEIAQLNLVNGSQAAGLHEQRSQGALHACLVEQNIISNSWQRNAAAESMNIFGAAQTSRNTGQSEYGSVESDYYNYVPK